MKRSTSFLLSMGICIAVITIFLALSSDAPVETLILFFTQTFSSWWYAGNMLNMAVLLIPAAIGSSLALRSGSFNLGGEAQLYAPALVTALILTRLPADVAAVEGFTVPALLVLAFVCALATGAILGAIPGILKASFRASELLTSFLLSAALVPLIDYLIAGPLRDQGKNLLATKPIATMFRIPPLIPPSFFNLSFLLVLALAFAYAFFLVKTGPGYRLGVSGIAPEFAAYTGMPIKRITIAGMSISGALHGLSGFLAVTGTWYTCHQGITSGMGWSALAIALIAGRNPVIVVPAALLYSWIQASGDNALLSTRFDFDSTAIIQAVLFLIISAQIVLPLRRRRRKTL